MKTVAFKTRARTVDHLGREQIADVPTAVSELWKNAYDAYARNVSLTIHDKTPLIVTIADDGHGMSYEELTERWLVIGTESKLFEDQRSDDDRNGLPERERQGQKGIGRLSSAHLGPLLLLITKRKGHNYAATLLDWRLFENPFLILSDIEVPVFSFKKPHQLIDEIPNLKASLLKNITGEGLYDDKASRLLSAWKSYDYQFKQKFPNLDPPSSVITLSLEQMEFDRSLFQSWDTWGDEDGHGTFMIIGHANDEFSIFLSPQKRLSSLDDDRERFYSTLEGFVDPLFDPAKPEINAVKAEFSYGVYVKENDNTNLLIGAEKEYNRSLTDEMEHIIEGTIDDNGFFTGQIKVFNEWKKIGHDYKIPPPKDFVVPSGSDTFLGPVDIYIATYEQNRANSTHSDMDFEKFRKTTEHHAGLMIYRDGLRVLPYGRVDNDFFEIEKQRSINAGREFWNARRMFGRLAISRARNPNLKDKAGREGFIVNKAAKTLKLLIRNVLREAAHDYFGTNSNERKTQLEINQQNYSEEQKKKAQLALRKKNRAQFGKNLKKNKDAIPATKQIAESLLNNMHVQSEVDISSAQEQLEKLENCYADLRLSGAPSPLGTLEDDYRFYQRNMSEIRSMIEAVSKRINEAIERIKPAKPEEILTKQIQRLQGQISAQIRKWSSLIKELQQAEIARISELIAQRNKVFQEDATVILKQFADRKLSLGKASKALSEIKQRIDYENEPLFENYIFALETLKENIDIFTAAIANEDEKVELQQEVARLNGLAQLGITVEFLSHEFNSYDLQLENAIKQLMKTDNSPIINDIKHGYEGLKQILDFLSPLQMAGHRERGIVTGNDIYDYCSRFFDKSIRDNNIFFEATDAFLKFSVFEYPSRLYPVFINLINNSLYWIINSRAETRRIRLDRIDDEIIVSDSGPGIDEIDIKRLFTLFFTRKIGGGRGVGLYLCRSNLAAGGHEIRYIQQKSNKLLLGANFAIKFRGAEFND